MQFAHVTKCGSFIVWTIIKRVQIVFSLLQAKNILDSSSPLRPGDFPWAHVNKHIVSSQ